MGSPASQPAVTTGSFHCGRSNELMPAVPMPESLGAVYVSLHQARARVEALGLALFHNTFPAFGRFPA